MSEVPVVKVTVSEPETEMKRLWDNYRKVGEVRKNNKIKIVVGAGIRDGVRYINIREFYQRKDEVWKPGRDGLTIPLKVPIENATQIIEPWAQLAALLLKTADVLESMELADEEHAVYAPMKRKEK